MNRVYLCMGKYAAVPYSFEKARIRIYSVEELCYFIKENACLVDDTLLSRELFDWLESQCGLGELRNRLLFSMKGGGKTEDLAAVILGYAGMSGIEEIKRIQSFIKAGADVSLPEKHKGRADYFLESRRYVLALQEYMTLLHDTDGAPSSFVGRIYHNMGVSQARLFLYEKAAPSFEQAYRLTGNQESLIQYLASMRFLLEEQEYVRFLANHPEHYEASLVLEQRMAARDEEWKDSEEAAVVLDLDTMGVERSMSLAELVETETSRLQDEYRDYVVQ